nr:PREDICTED: uncharacterized protein LOC105678159 [Linepithema humile]
MDSFVMNTLKEWGLEELIPTFAAQKIDTEVFNTLTDNDIESLISEVGTKRKFLNKYQNLKNSVLPVTEKIFSEIIFDTDWASSSTTILSSLSDINPSPSTSSVPSKDEEILINEKKCLNKATVGLPRKIYANQNCNSVSYAHIHIHVKIFTYM